MCRAIEIAATGDGERLMRDAAQRRIDSIVLALGRLAPAEQRRLTAAASLLDRVASDIGRQERGVIS
jgi:hypothetical protein